ncbi:MAG: hypothetical protein WKF57_17555 [Nakamurella sp.]
MKFRDHDGDGPEPDDGLEARLTADAESWLRGTMRSFSDSPAALLPGVSRVRVTPAEEPAVHQDEARDDAEVEPTVSVQTRGAWARRAPALVAAAVIALVAAVAIPLLANRSHLAGDGSKPSCAALDGERSPDRGTVRPAAGSLVPDEVPISMLICQYPSSAYLAFDPGEVPTSYAVTPDPQRLTTSRIITSGLSAVPGDLSRYSVSDQEQSCSYGGFSGGGVEQVLGSEFKVALEYPDGVIWLSDTSGLGGCAVASGTAGFAAGTYADLFARSLASGTWESSAYRSAACPLQVDASPFAGTEALPEPTIDTGGALVPMELPSAVVLCGYLQAVPVDVAGYDSPLGFIARRLELQGDYSALVADLRQGQVIPGGVMRCPKPEESPTHQLIGLTYGPGAARRTIWVDAPLDAHCGLAINGSTWVLGNHARTFRDALAGDPWPGLKAIDLSTIDAPTVEPSTPAIHPEPSPSAPAVAPINASCPVSVDATPFQGAQAIPGPSIDTGGQLVPEQLPSAVVLCGYAVAEPSGEPGLDSPVGHIHQRIVVEGDYSTLIALLRQGTAVDPSRMECPVVKDAQIPQLIALTYGAATIWVDVRSGGPCGIATNGVVSTTSPIARSVLDARHGIFWEGTSGRDLNPVEPSAAPSPTEPVASAPETFSAQEQQACDDFNPGSGPDLAKTMIPAGYTSVISCLAGKVELPARMVTRINALSYPVDSSACPGGDTYQDMDETPTLVFLYPDRDPVFLYFYDYCAPLIGNWDREVAVPKDILDQLLKLAGY